MTNPQKLQCGFKRGIQTALHLKENEAKVLSVQVQLLLFFSFLSQSVSVLSHKFGQLQF